MNNRNHICLTYEEFHNYFRHSSVGKEHKDYVESLHGKHYYDKKFEMMVKLIDNVKSHQSFIHDKVGFDETSYFTCKH